MKRITAFLFGVLALALPAGAAADDPAIASKRITITADVSTNPQPGNPSPDVPRTRRDKINNVLISAAGNYAVLKKSIRKTGLDSFRSASDLNQTMDALARAYPKNLGPTFLGYGAMVGAQNAEFAATIRTLAREQGLETLIYHLYSTPGYATTLPGAKAAARDIQSAWNDDVAGMKKSGALVKQQSYNLQKQAPWKTRKVDDRNTRLHVLNRAKSIKDQPPVQTRVQLAAVDVSNGASNAFWQIFDKPVPPAHNTNTTHIPGSMNTKALTLSALEILGATGPANRRWIENFMVSPRLEHCVATAQLNAEQCVAAGYFKYEDAFCIAEHQLTEVGDCLEKNAR